MFKRRLVLPGRLTMHGKLLKIGLPILFLTLGIYTLLRALPKNSSGKNEISVIDLQLRRATTSTMVSSESQNPGAAQLINLNPKINVWYILRIKWNRDGVESFYHLENPLPKKQRYYLDKMLPDNIVIDTEKEKTLCLLHSSDPDQNIETARLTRKTYAPLCDGRIYLLNPTRSRRTFISTITDLLRDQVPGGEAIIGFAKGTIYKDEYRIEPNLKEGGPAKGVASSENAPPAARINSSLVGNKQILPVHLGISLEKSDHDGLVPGSWVPVEDNPGIFVSALRPDMIHSDILKSYPDRVNTLDDTEASSLVYLIAFDLARFDLGFAVGTEHPRVDWSERVSIPQGVPRLAGPDGIGKIDPLVATGLVSPENALRTVATFAGGFKRYHGAFSYGELARQNHGSHYGFLQNGVILSRLQPGIATVTAAFDGTVDLKTWTLEEEVRVHSLFHARQNGVPIVEFSFPAGRVVPGPLVANWGEGNWSGSASGTLRSLRSALALQETPRKRFLIYAYFSDATPSAMARVFQAYECQYAMLLDMNALEHTYMALYRRRGASLFVQHLIREMEDVDSSYRGEYVPRFIGFSDLRDFFYIMRKKK